MHIAFAIDAGFLPWCAVVIRSCLDHGGEDLTIHVLHDGALDGNPGVGLLAAMVNGAGATLEMHSVDAAAVSSLPAVDRYGAVVWLRFLLPNLLPDIDRVLYLDADTLVVSPLGPLASTDLNGAPIGAVANVVTPEHRARIRDLGIEDYRCFLNSGVLLLDLERLRAEDASHSLLRVATTRASELVWPDQDSLNVLFVGRWHVLHPRWNAQNTLWTEAEIAADVFGMGPATEARRWPAILHFEGPNLCKPWHALSSHPWRRAWWETLDRTPWKGTRAEDQGLATAALRLLPEYPRIRGYGRLLQWRERRSVAT